MIGFWILISCNAYQSNMIDKTKDQTGLSKAEVIVKNAIAAHGGSLSSLSYQFVFRGKKYRFYNNGNQYTYQVEAEKEGVITKDVLTNEGLTRTVNGQVVNLSTTDRSKYAESLNSVIYFATLPHKLQDDAVNLVYKGTTLIKESSYLIIEVTFDVEGGGKDHDDTFYYWINSDSNQVDYLAYNYKVNGGGVRFRTAYNKRIVDGVLFQDYVNYKAEVGTPLSDLPALYVGGKLKELSRIDTEDVLRLE